MAWTYDVTKFNDTTASSSYPPATIGVRYQVRLLIQDTNTNRQLLQDEEIDWLQTQDSNTYGIAASCCDVLVGKGGTIKSKTVGDLSLTYDVAFYRGLAGTLRSRALSAQVPYCGGISITDKIAQQADTDAVQPNFAKGMENNPGAPTPAITSPNPLVRGY